MLSGPGDLLVFSELTLSLTDCDVGLVVLFKVNSMNF